MDPRSRRGNTLPSQTEAAVDHPGGSDAQHRRARNRVLAVQKILHGKRQGEVAVEPSGYMKIRHHIIPEQPPISVVIELESHKTG